MVNAIKFKKFISEASEEEYGNLLDDVASLLDTVGDQLVYVKKSGDAYTCIQLSGENYVEVKVQGSEQDIIKTQKIYKDGEVTNYDLAIRRLKELKAAIENEQFISQGE
jgi:hypothetical protein